MRIKELRNKNKLYARVIDEILEDSKNYEGTKKERIIKRCNDVNYGLSTGIVSSLVYNEDTTNFYDEYYDEIYELIEELEDDGFDLIESLKKDLETYQIIMNDQNAKNNIVWIVYEEIAYQLLNTIEG